jgi:uncharacterized membrane protein
MQKRQLSLTNVSSNWLKIFIIVVLVIGIFFRFLNLDKKVYWGDEVFSSLQIAGYTISEVEQELSQSKIIGIQDLQKYQGINTEKGLIDTIKVSTKDVHPPLYYALLRLWAQCFGSSVASTRSLSALISLLAFPCIYWLCQELFESSLVGWIAIALIASSPFHVLYAQEARMYSLWTVTILLSSTTLLQAIRFKTKLNWGIYGITLVIGLYSFLFTGFVAVGHGIYVFINERFRLTKTLKAYLLASLASLLAFVPWLLVLITNLSSFQSGIAWAEQDKPLSFLLSYWFYNLCYIFIDFFYFFVDFPENYLNFGYGKFLVPLILILEIYSVYFLIRNTPQRVWLFIITLIFTTAIAVTLPDLIKGGYRSIMARYFIPSYLGIQLAVAYLLARKIYLFSLKNWQQKVWRLLAVVLISGGILSCTISSQAETWWNKRVKYPDLQVSYIINSQTNPLLLFSSVSSALNLYHQLDSQVKVLIFTSSNIPKIPDSFSNIFTIQDHRQKLSQSLKDELANKQNYKINRVYQGRRMALFQLDKNLPKD